MKRYYILILTVIAILMVNCTENDKSLGVTIQPEEDDIKVGADTFHIKSENYYVPGISAQADSMIVGEFYSEKYGSTKAELLVQVAPPIGYKFPDEAKKPTPDSLVLIMYYNNWFGSPYTPLEFSIYELNKQSIDYNTQYLSNLNPGDFTDSTILMGKRLATSIDVTKKDSTKKEPVQINYIRYKFDDTQLNRFFDMPKDIYNSEEAFLDQFKGMYITTRYGASTLINFNQITLFLYYHYSYNRNGKDTVVNTSIVYPANKEVRQLNRFVHEDIEKIAVCHDSINYIKSAGGIYPKLHIPIGRMKQRINEKIGDKILNINAAEMIVENIAYDDKDVFMDPPANLLILTSEEFDNFIKYNTIPTAIDTTALLGSFVAAKNGYKFNFNYFLSKHLRNENISPEQELEMILMPVDVESVTSTATGAVTIKKIKPLTKLAATTIRSGSNGYSPLRMKILYNGF